MRKKLEDCANLAIVWEGVSSVLTNILPRLISPIKSTAVLESAFSDTQLPGAVFSYCLGVEENSDMIGYSGAFLAY